MSQHARRVAWVLSALVPLAAAWTLWRPVLDNYFFYDDFFHLFDLATRPFADFVMQIWGGHLYVVRNTVFAGMFTAFGAEPRPYFWSVLLTHLVNVLLLHQVIRRLTGDTVLAFAGAVLWGTCPALEGALGWYAVYGQVLLTAVVLVVLLQLADTAASGRTLSLRRALGWAALLFLGGGCFGTGLGIAVVFPLVSIVGLASRQRSARAVGALALAPALLLIVYVLLPDQTRQITPEARDILAVGAILRDLPEALGLTFHLIVFGSCTLLLGFLGRHAGYPSAVAAGAAGAVALVVVAASYTSDAALRRRLAALSLLVVAAYGAVAVGRVTVIALLPQPIALAAGWPRYHYLPLTLLSALLGSGLSGLGARGRVARGTVHAVATLWTVARLVLLVTNPLPIDHHDAARAETETMLRSIHDAAAAAAPGSTAVIENRPFASFPLPRTLPGWAGLFVVFFPEDTVDGRPVRFAVGEVDWRVAQARGGRIAALVERR